MHLKLEYEFEFEFQVRHHYSWSQHKKKNKVQKFSYDDIFFSIDERNIKKSIAS